ncbi:MAG: hypothetical protein PVS2B1_24370 [Candidatus Dormibacteraceae bacterium]
MSSGRLSGLCPVALYAIGNKHLGTSAAYSQIAKGRVRRVTELWPAYYASVS